MWSILLWVKLSFAGGRPWRDILPLFEANMITWYFLLSDNAAQLLTRITVRAAFLLYGTLVLHSEAPLSIIALFWNTKQVNDFVFLGWVKRSWRHVWSGESRGASCRIFSFRGHQTSLYSMHRSAADGLMTSVPLGFTMPIWWRRLARGGDSYRERNLLTLGVRRRHRPACDRYAVRPPHTICVTSTSCDEKCWC